MLVKVINNHDEAYTIEKVSPIEDGLLRVDLANHPPFTSGWYQVNLLDPVKRNRLTSSRSIIQGVNSPWWQGCKAWFPERGRTYTIRESGSDRARVDFVEAVDLKADGIVPGDWFVIYAIEPGLKITVPDDYVWRAEAMGGVNVGLGSAWEAVTNPEDFESYSTGAWTTAGPPTAANEGWNVSHATGTGTVFRLDATDGFGGTQGLRIDASYNTGSGNKGLATWYASADINTLPQQTLYAEWQGVFRNDASFGRVVFNQTANDANFIEMRSDGAVPTLRAGQVADYDLPTDVVGFSWPSDVNPTAWYTVEIQFDYTSDKIRARFGTRTNLTTRAWNSYTPWLDMHDTTQQVEVRTFVEGRVQMDNFSLTAIPEPVTLRSR